MRTTLTLRQRITRREYRRGWVTQAEMARRFGVSQSAISQRLAASRGPRRAAMGRRTRIRPLSLDLSGD